MEKKEVEAVAREMFKSNTRWSDRLMGIRRAVEEIGRNLPPEDDWIPAVIIEGEVPKTGPLPPDFKEEQRGEKGRFIFGFAGDIMGSEEGKDFLAYIMRGMALAFRATAMTFISCVWASFAHSMPPVDQKENESDEDFNKRMESEAKEHTRKHGTPSQDPNRLEKLMMLSVSYGGDEDGSRQAFASIKRYKDKPPALYDWVIADNSEGGFIGRFPDAIYSGLKAAQEAREAEENGGYNES